MSFPFIVKNTMAEMRNMSTVEITDLQNGIYKGVSLLGYYEQRDTPSPIIYHLSTSGTDDGGSIIETGGIKLKHNFTYDLDIRYFGVKGNGMYNDTPFILSYFNYVNANNLFWVIPGAFKVVVKKPFEIKTSGRCEGKFILINENGDVIITIARRFPGEAVDISTWITSKMKRGSLDVGFINTGVANLYFDSEEILIDRDGTPSETNYKKREFIRSADGKLTTPLVCSYKQDSNNSSVLNVKKYILEEPISIDNLSIETAGNLNVNTYLLVSRDNVTLNNPQIFNKINNVGAVALEVNTCADIIINNPFIKGFRKDGEGYGIANYYSIGVIINDGNVVECRHGYTGRNSVDVTINRGVWEDGIDDHWTDRFTANETIIKTGTGSAAFQFAGNDITLNSPVVNGSAIIFFGIRLDTPSLGGIVNINNPVFNTKNFSGEPGIRDIYMFSYTSPGGNVGEPMLPNYTIKPTLPESLNIINPIINTDADVVYSFFLGVLNREYINLKNLRITDTILNAKPTTKYTAVQIVKDGVKQLEHGTNIEISGRLVTNALATTSVYLNSMDKTDYIRRANIYLTDCFGYGRVVFSGANLATLIMDGGDINDFNTDYTYASYADCNIQFKDVVWRGGSIDKLSHALFQNCVFTGSYTFPSADSVTLVNNVKYAGVSGLPSNIVNSMNPPFA
ncbi:hypothetical protein [Chryseobacterium lathyri]|uniref:hypothetical protein n=1 Tax=Chryseobacterium lathyri TaxID=395933 RepID=UPI0027847643|nr:hypothetical protein [Chryseobacterium lathyri]MDQ0066677.1 hypothetical protein [Chryseobacterium lathyri]